MLFKSSTAALVAVTAFGTFMFGCASTQSGSDRSKTTAAKDAGSIVDVAVGNGSFTTLITALKAADLVNTLSGEGPFTVFAPTDDAFAKLPEGTVESLLEDKEKLTKILTYHVVSGNVMAADVVKLASADTLAGVPVSIDASDGVMVGSARVVTADVKASNGVIHVIDTVLIPE